jgi:hypothetical protein
MRKIFLIFFIIFSCARVYKKEINFYDFKKIILNKYENREIKYIYAEGDFESYGTNYMKGFFILKFEKDTFLIKVFSPPFFVKDIHDKFLRDAIYLFFNPLNFFEKYKVLSFKENEKSYEIELNNFLIIFDKENVFLRKILFKNGSIIFSDFEDFFPKEINFSYFDEKIKLKMRKIDYEF